jgi:O-antigen ligase
LVFGFAVALFGIIQYFSFNGKLYWLRELRYGGSVFGPYVNHNHFAGLMELIVPLGLALLLLRAVTRDKLLLVGLFSIISIGALFLSASRGGLLTFLSQLCLLGFLVWARRAGRKSLALATAIILLAGAFVTWLGVGRTFERFSQLWAEDISHNIRMLMFKDSWQIFLDHPWAGTGVGTLVTVYPQYASNDHGMVVDHAHNDYLEMLAETGLIGALCSLAFIVLLFRFALVNLQSDQSRFLLAVRAGALVACSGLLLHSLVDFNFHIPSNALLFFLLAALATGGSNPETPAKRGSS